MPHNDEIRALISDVREQVLYMQELGVERLDVDLGDAVPVKSEAQPAALKNEIANELPAEPSSVPTKIEVAKTPVKKRSKLAEMPSLSKRSGIRASSTETANSEPAPAEIATASPGNNAASLTDALFDVGPESPQTGETIEDIRKDIGDCTRCELYTGRTQVVHSTGNFQADLMFVGEAPGADEDAQGFPFVGRAGQLLTKIIEGIGYKREDVFIGNINRCRPPGNRAPTLPEAHTCRPFLLREIAVVRPKVIVVMGNTAMHNLLDTKVGITKMRGHFQDYFGVKVMPTFHPAFLLRDPHKKREVWEDMKKVRDYLKTGK